MLGSNHCYLKGKNPTDLALIKECPYDPKGYFIIKGVEKVVLMQEQMSRNRILVEKDNKSDGLVANCASNTLETKSRISLLIKGGKIYLKSNSFTEIIPIMIVFKAMGFIQDQEIVQMIGCEKKILEEVFLSFQVLSLHPGSSEAPRPYSRRCLEVPWRQN
jgi:DNA-directed RNA polymerase III subunit RPC2